MLRCIARQRASQVARRRPPEPTTIEATPEALRRCPSPPRPLRRRVRGFWPPLPRPGRYSRSNSSASVNELGGLRPDRLHHQRQRPPPAHGAPRARGRDEKILHLVGRVVRGSPARGRDRTHARRGREVPGRPVGVRSGDGDGSLPPPPHDRRPPRVTPTHGRKRVTNLPYVSRTATRSTTQAPSRSLFR